MLSVLSDALARQIAGSLGGIVNMSSGTLSLADGTVGTLTLNGQVSFPAATTMLAPRRAAVRICRWKAWTTRMGDLCLAAVLPADGGAIL